MASYLADTNLLLRLADPDSEQHAVATQALARLLGKGDEVYLTPQNFIEFWAVATRPVEVNGFGWTSERTAKEVADLQERFAMSWNDLTTTVFLAPVGDRVDFDQMKSYFTDAARGADRKFTAPLDSPSSSYSFDGIREGVAVIRRP